MSRWAAFLILIVTLANVFSFVKEESPMTFSEASRAIASDVFSEGHDGHHDDCDGSGTCHYHICHVGHCAFLFLDEAIVLSPDSPETLRHHFFVSTYPDAPLFGLKRPPRA